MPIRPKRSQRCPTCWKIVPPGTGYKSWGTGMFCSQADYAVYMNRSSWFYGRVKLAIDHVHGRMKKRKEKRGQSKPR